MAVKSYTAKDIAVLDPLEGARKRPSTYLGDVEERGAHIALKEPLDNARDEALASKTMYVGVEVSDNVVTYWDKGRGIPVEQHAKGMSALEAVITRLHAGGKFEKSGAYEGSGTIGTFGVGVSVTAAVSRYFDVWTYRKGWYHLGLERGVVTHDVGKIKSPPHKLAVDGDAATIVQLELDDQIFGDKLMVDVPRLQQLVRLYAYLNPGMTFEFFRDGKRVAKYLFKDGPLDLVDEMVKEQGKKLPPDEDVLTFKAEGVDLTLCWIANPDPNIRTFCCGSPTEENGTHYNGLRRALIEVIGGHGKKRDNFDDADLLNGATGILNIDVLAPEFGGATKNRLTSKAADERVYRAALPRLEKFFRKHRDLGRELVDKAIELTKVRAKSKQDRDVAADVQETKKGKDNLPVAPTFARADCEPHRRELYIVEGGSAGGTAKACRDKSYQEVLALSGKPPNAIRKGRADAGGNQHVKNLLACVGIVPGKNLESTLRIGKLILMADADDDGAHITILVMSVLHEWGALEWMIGEGMICTVDAGLYNTYWRGRYVWARSELELRKAHPDMPLTQHISRLKGWGEANVSMLKPVAFDRGTRTLIRLDPHKGAAAYFMALMGKDGDIRKELMDL